MLPLILGVSGLAMQLGGAYFSYQGAQQSNQAQQKQIELEQKAEVVKRQYMEADYNRKSVENLRKTMQLSALSLNNSVSAMGGSAIGSSALAGGQAQVQGQGKWNQKGLDFSLQTGEQIFDINQQISEQKKQILQGQQNSLFGNALGSFGSSLIGAMGPAGQLAGGGGMSSMGTSIWNRNTNNFMGSGSFNNG